MEDLQKIKEFFSKSLKEATFKKGDKITYLGHPGVIKAVNKEMTGDITYTVSYDKGTGKTTASNLSNKGGEIKMAEAITTAYEGKKETAVDMAKKQLDALGVKYELSGNEFKPFKTIYKPTNKPDRWYDEFEDIIHLFNLGSAVKQSMSEANGFKSGKEFINIKLKNYPKAVAKINQLINMIGESNFTMEMAEWIWDFFNNAHFERPVNEAKEEDKVDTITMDVPLFIRMLEYSREDASQDMDLHDVTEKANKLGKEKGILSMEDYEEIVGAAEEIQEIEDDKFKNDPWKGGPEYKKEDLLAQKIFGIKYFGWLDSWEQFHLVNKYNLDKNIITKEGKEINLKQSKLSSAEYQKAKKLKDFKASDWKWNADEDLYTKVNEAELTEAYVPSNIKEFAKRKGVSSLVNKVAGWAEKVGKGIRGGTAIGYNYSTLILDMTYQGSEIRINTDNDTVTLYDEPVYSFNNFKQVYLDNQDESDNGLEERIAEALDKINEELCPAGKAYIKRRKAAGEKSSAYLSGRAVKVCKGQMSGTSKKKK